MTSLLNIIAETIAVPICQLADWLFNEYNIPREEVYAKWYEITDMKIEEDGTFVKTSNKNVTISKSKFSGDASSCKYIFTTGDKKGQQCSVKPKTGEMCGQHRKKTLDVTSGDEDQVDACSHVFTIGQKKGKRCNVKPKNGAEKCSQHSKEKSVKKPSKSDKSPKKLSKKQISESESEEEPAKKSPKKKLSKKQISDSESEEEPAKKSPKKKLSDSESKKSPYDCDTDTQKIASDSE
jgi:hypothetical protein